MEASVYQNMAAVEGEHWWFAARRRIVADMIERLDLPVHSEILEIGAGTGGNLGMLSEFGRVVAVEMAPEARSLARKRWAGEVLDGRLPDGMPSLERRFDLIVMLDILEHVEADAESLRRVAAMLRPGGHVLITVPAFPFLWSRHDELHHHFRRYRRQPLRALVSDMGLEVQRDSYFNFFLFPLVAGVRLLEPFVGTRNSGGDLKVPTPWVNQLLKGIFAAERKLLPWFSLPFGVSLLVVARRPR